MRKNEQKIKKTTTKTFLKREFSLLRGEIKTFKPYNLLIC